MTLGSAGAPGWDLARARIVASHTFRVARAFRSGAGREEPCKKRSMIDLHWIAEHLAIGARFPMEACESLVREHGVQSVVDVRQEASDDPEALGRHGLELLHLPTPDMAGVPVDLLDRGVDWVRGRMSLGRRVLIHCEHGIGRSALLGCCVLVAEGAAPLDALRHAKSRRKVMAFSVAQQQRFVEWCRTHRERSGRRYDLPDPEAIQRIVWT